MDVDVDATFPAVLRRQAEVLSDAPFMRVWARGEGQVCSFSFRSFELRVAIARGALAAHGVARGQRVALLSHYTPQFAIYSLAVMCLGGVSVHLNWRQVRLTKPCSLLSPPTPSASSAHPLPVQPSSRAA